MTEKEKKSGLSKMEIHYIMIGFAGFLFIVKLIASRKNFKLSALDIIGNILLVILCPYLYFIYFITSYITSDKSC